MARVSDFGNRNFRNCFVYIVLEKDLKYLDVVVVIECALLSSQKWAKNDDDPDRI